MRKGGGKCPPRNGGVKVGKETPQDKNRGRNRQEDTKDERPCQKEPERASEAQLQREWQDTDSDRWGSMCVRGVGRGDMIHAEKELKV